MAFGPRDKIKGASYRVSSITYRREYLSRRDKYIDKHIDSKEKWQRLLTVYTHFINIKPRNMSQTDLDPFS